MAWLKKAKKGTGMLEAAWNTLSRHLEQGYEPELVLLLGTDNPQTLLDDEFTELCESVLKPIWEAGTWL